MRLRTPWPARRRRYCPEFIMAYTTPYPVLRTQYSALGGRMKVVGVETLLVSLPTRRVHAWAGLSTAIGRDYVLVRLRSDEGLEGWGEAPVLKDWGGDHGRYFGESPQTTVVVVPDSLAPALEGADPLALEGAYARLDRAVRG